MAGSAGAHLFRQGESVRTVPVLGQTPAERPAEAIDFFSLLNGWHSGGYRQAPAPLKRGQASNASARPCIAMRVAWVARARIA
jgi:hypothetical protein